MKCRNCKHLYKDWCVHKLDSPDPDLDRECKDYMQITNGDRIRAMTDEELADIFLRADFCKCCKHKKDGVCNYICAYPNIPLYDGCIQTALKWMKQPAEEDT